MKKLGDALKGAIGKGTTLKKKSPEEKLKEAQEREKKRRAEMHALVKKAAESYPKAEVEEVECKANIDETHVEIPCEKTEGRVKIVAISDTHDRHTNMDELPKADILVHGGDFSMIGEPKKVKAFAEWLKYYLDEGYFKHVVIIAGNHDVTFHPEYFEKTGKKRFFGARNPDLKKVKKSLAEIDPRVHYLEDESITLMGVKFWGSPWSPFFCDWAFNADRGEMSEKIYAKIPEDTDVLITHGPPTLHGDKVPLMNAAMSGGRQHVGCDDLHNRVLKVDPQFHIFGHIHEGYGVTRQKGLQTYFINASSCTLKYRPTNPPVMFYVDPTHLAKMDEAEKKEVDPKAEDKKAVADEKKPEKQLTLD